MFGFFKKKKNESVESNNQIYAVATGNLIPINEVSDPVFSQKMMGDGYAVIPESGEIFSPIKGKVLSVFQTKHAVGLRMANGLEVLLHMGIDTVELKGSPFDVKVSEGNTVDSKTLIAKVNLEEIKAAGKSTDMVVVLTNMDAVKSFNLEKNGVVTAGEAVGTATAE